MSLFDVIKYPISNPPSPEELFVLPTDVYSGWCRDLLGGTYTPYFVSGYLHTKFFVKPIEYMDEIYNLKKRLEEYEPL